MEYLDNKASWEEFFTKEYSDFKAKLSDLETGKSHLRLALENKILDWKAYESWAIEKFGCASIKEGTSEIALSGFLENAKTTYMLFSSHKFWSKDLVPVFFWENQLIVFGLHYHPELAKIPDHIFIFASPKILNYFSEVSAQQVDQDLTEPNIKVNENYSVNIQAEEVTNPGVLALNLDTKTAFDFKPIESSSIKEPSVGTSDIWEVLAERYDEYLFEARKLYEALVILKINSDVTELFRLDKDLTKRDLSDKVFEYSVTRDEVFKDVYKSGTASKTTSRALGLDMLNYENICLAPIKKGSQVVGFFVGFKYSKILPADVALLEELTADFSQAA